MALLVTEHHCVCFLGCLQRFCEFHWL